MVSRPDLRLSRGRALYYEKLRRTMENFWAGVCAPREGGNPETGVPVHRETPSQASLKGNCKVLENQAKQGLGGK